MRETARFRVKRHEENFSDDVSAVQDLEARIAEREAECDRKAAWNSAWKRGAGAAGKRAKAAGKTGEDLLIARLDGGEQALREMGAPHTIIMAANETMEPGYSWVKAPFDLTHLRASIRRDRERLAEIRARQARHEAAEAAGGVKVLRDELNKRCTVTFAERPPQTVIEALRAASYGYGAGSWSGYLDRLPDEVRT